MRDEVFETLSPHVPALATSRGAKVNVLSSGSNGVFSSNITDNGKDLRTNVKSAPVKFL